MISLPNFLRFPARLRLQNRPAWAASCRLRRSRCPGARWGAGRGQCRRRFRERGPRDCSRDPRRRGDRRDLVWQSRRRRSTWRLPGKSRLRSICTLLRVGFKATTFACGRGRVELRSTTGTMAPPKSRTQQKLESEGGCPHRVIFSWRLVRWELAGRAVLRGSRWRLRGGRGRDRIAGSRGRPWGVRVPKASSSASVQPPFRRMAPVMSSGKAWR